MGMIEKTGMCQNFIISRLSNHHRKFSHFFHLTALLHVTVLLTTKIESKSLKYF